MGQRTLGPAAVGDRPPAMVVMDEPSFRAHFDAQRLARLDALVDLGGQPWFDTLDDALAASRLSEAEVLLTSWGAPTLTAGRLAGAPRLKAVFHCAGSVRQLVTEEVWRRGLLVTSGAAANAVPVAEFTLAMVLLAGKKAPFIAASGLDRAPGHDDPRWGDLSNHARTVGVVGFSRIGRLVVERLVSNLEGVRVLVSDPYADPEDVAAKGAELMDLHELLPQVDTLTIHAPALPSTTGLIGRTELSALPDHATVVNTARGSLVDHEALADECGSGRLFAILDVTDPEPLSPDSPLRAMPTVLLTPHLAGSLGTEVHRLTDHALGELARWRAGEPVTDRVTADSMALRA
jgi:phosphoglycerate dehydrogenase-like enzyme